MSFWSLDYLDLTDTLNEEIWRASPARGAALKVRLRLDRHGGLQDMNLDMLGGLPWVPDLVGRHWREADSVLVVGSAYAPFIPPWAGRTSAMNTRDYRDAKSAAEFLRRFFSTVVAGDRAYYEPIGELLSGITSPDRVVLTDLCRASFVRRDGPGKVTSGDAAVKDAPDVYGAYVEAGEDWTWQRIEQCTGRVIVTLGKIAEQGLLEVFRRQGYLLSIPAAPHVTYTPVRPGDIGSITRPTTIADQRRRAGWWWRAVRGDREYRVAAVVHPSYWYVHDPGFIHSRELIIAARKGLRPRV